MPTSKSHITVQKLRSLLIELRDKRPDICLRYRLMGELWKPNFCRITLITENGVVLNDEVLDKPVALPHLFTIMQFEIDKPFQEFQPFFHYILKT